MAVKNYHDQFSTKECAGRGDRTRGRLHAKRTRFQSSYCAPQGFEGSGPEQEKNSLNVREHVNKYNLWKPETTIISWGHDGSFIIASIS